MEIKGSRFKKGDLVRIVMAFFTYSKRLGRVEDVWLHRPVHSCPILCYDIQILGSDGRLLRGLAAHKLEKVKLSSLSPLEQLALQADD